ncbi:MAG: cation:proton antiporter [Jatrophihabitantaceae bacterium]
MAESYSYGGLLLLIGAVGVLAVLAGRITQRVPVPAPALLLGGTAVAVQLLPGLHRLAAGSADRVVTVALILILFDGGRQLGWSSSSRAARPIVLTGVLGTFLTAAGGALVAHLLGLPWYPALLVGVAIAPTDPAVVFSVLGQREISGASGTILQGESGANDPVGIALMASLLSAGQLSGSALGSAAGEFLLQLGVGALVGVLGGRLLLVFSRRVRLPTAGLYPVRTLAGSFVLFGAATLAHGSGFLAVFIAGILLGEADLPYQREVEHVHAAAASLGEIVAFVALGMTVDVAELSHRNVWLPGLVLGVLLTVLVRPLLVGGCLIGSGLAVNERALVLLAGLKGAVPILLGTFLLDADLPDTERLYGIVVLVVVFSVSVQATALPAVAAALKVPMHTIEPQPWALGVRLRNAPAGAHRLTVTAGSAADGSTVAELVRLPETAWISFLVRDGTLLPVSAGTVLRAGDEVLVLADPELSGELDALFGRPGDGVSD